MAWSGSGWHGSWFALSLNSATSDNNLTHAMAYALYDNTAAPNPSAAVLAAYGAGGYALGEQTSDPGWPAGGLDLFNSAGRLTGDQVAAIADDLTTVSPVTLTPHGGMVYDHGSVISPGAALCYHWYGGPVPAVNGQFTVLWHADGIAVMSCPLLPRTARRAPAKRKRAA